jgi:hypothetical protein
LRLRIARAIAEVDQAKPHIRPAAYPLKLRPALLTAGAFAVLAAFGVLMTQSFSPSQSPALTAPLSINVANGYPHLTRHSMPPAASLPHAMDHQPRPLQVAAKPRTTERPDFYSTALSARPRVAAPPIKVASIPSKELLTLPEKPAAKLRHPLSPAPHQAISLRSEALMAERGAAGTVNHAFSAEKLNKSTVEASKAIAPNSEGNALPDRHLETAQATVASLPDGSSIAPNPGPAQVDVTTPVSTRPVHEDMLSTVRARLTSLRTGNMAIKVYRDANSHARDVVASAISDESNQPPIYGVVYSPTTIPNHE